MPRSRPPTDVPDVPVLKNPHHIDEFMLYRIHKLARVAAQGVGLMFRREIGISRRDWRILAFVGRYPDINLTRLAELAVLDTVVASRCVAQLVKKGLITSVRRPSNKRIVVLTLTDAGRVTWEKARAGGQQYNIRFMECLSDQEAIVLDLLLTRLEKRAEELTDSEIEKSGGRHAVSLPAG